jgi:hypothetical protein
MLGHFPARACPAFDAGQDAIRVKTTRQMNKSSAIPIESEWKRLDQQPRAQLLIHDEFVRQLTRYQ